ncbi:type I-E CRISPR-associated protein Cse1/CasA [Actinomadura kijaniata]|uniref:type I-E CRISPR-associated protein Cse1/CasA n=1 Tax=Actinomadura kijaniata TaxID=46161 RepID=UPI003F1C98C9
MKRWLPARVNGEITSLGLRELFAEAHQITDVEVGPPPAAAGLWRVLTVMAARITGLDHQQDGIDEWQDARDAVLEAGRFPLKSTASSRNSIESYFFNDFPDRFGLFHPERPWLQDPRLMEQCTRNTGLNKLVMSRPAGNNQPWFDHHHNGLAEPLETPEAILHLIAQLYYGPSGQCTPRTVDGQTNTNTAAGPLRRVISFHPVGANLFESLILNIPYLGRVRRNGEAFWETSELTAPRGVPPKPEGVGGVLANRFRHAVLLIPTPDGNRIADVRITWALRDQFPPVEDPYLVYQNNKQGEPYARPASAARALWRDLDSLLLKDAGVEHRRRPKVLDNLQILPKEQRERLRVRAFGFDQDGQTRNKQWFSATTPPALLDMLDDQPAAAGVGRTREAAERVERHLRSALRAAWTAINDPSNGDGKPARKDIPEGPWPMTAAQRYWPAAEALFWKRVRDRDFDDPARSFISLALNVYDRVTDQAGARPRAKRAIERARGYIFQANNTRETGTS